MPPKIIWMILAAMLFAIPQETSLAQDFHIYTRIFDESAVMRGADNSPGTQAPIVARSMSLFHAGNVYDWIDIIGELIVYQPAHGRFKILNEARMMKTEVEFDQLKRFLKIARRDASNYIERLEQQGHPDAQAAVDILRFQLEPKFQEQYDQQRKRLTLTSPHLHYDVRCHASARPELVLAYLEYADWMARLNHVLHPHALYPGPRLALNEQLRRRNLLPVEVELEFQTQPRLHLRAEHKIHWQLNRTDRTTIHRWNQLLKSDDVKFVTFGEYRDSLLRQPGANKQ